MHTEDFFIYDGGDWEAIEAVWRGLKITEVRMSKLTNR